MTKFWKWRDMAPVTDEAPQFRELILDGEIASETWWGDEVTPQVFREELNHDMTKGTTGQIHHIILADLLDCLFCNLPVIWKNGHGFKLAVNGRSDADLLWQDRTTMCPLADALLFQKPKIPAG